MLGFLMENPSWRLNIIWLKHEGQTWDIINSSQYLNHTNLLASCVAGVNIPLPRTYMLHTTYVHTHTPIQLLDFWHAIASWLVVLTCFNHLEKYEFVNGKDDIPYEKKHVWNHQPATVQPATQEIIEALKPLGAPAGTVSSSGLCTVCRPGFCAFLPWMAWRLFGQKMLSRFVTRESNNRTRPNLKT